jgi:hypothetical protein
LRQHAGLVDQSRVLELNAELRREHLPGYEPLSADDARSAVLMLSDGCSTCFEIARALPTRLVPQLQVVVTARSQEAGVNWLSRFDLAPSRSIVIDDGASMDAAGLELTPSLITFVGQAPRSAISVPSVRQLTKALEWVTGRPTPKSPRQQEAKSAKRVRVDSDSR